MIQLKRVYEKPDRRYRFDAEIKRSQPLALAGLHAPVERDASRLSVRIQLLRNHSDLDCMPFPASSGRGRLGADFVRSLP